MFKKIAFPCQTMALGGYYPPVNRDLAKIRGVFSAIWWGAQGVGKG